MSNAEVQSGSRLQEYAQQTEGMPSIMMLIMHSAE
jgi:hypothetical protein